MVSVGEKRWEGGELCWLVAMELTLLAEIPELLPLLLLPANLAKRKRERETERKAARVTFNFGAVDFPFFSFFLKCFAVMHLL